MLMCYLKYSVDYSSWKSKLYMYHTLVEQLVIFFAA